MHLQKIFKSALTLFVVAAAFVTTTTIHAANRYWTGSGAPGDWNDPLNWRNGSIPTTSDSTYFSSSIFGDNKPVISSGTMALGPIIIAVDGNNGNRADVEITGSAQMTVGNVTIGRTNGGDVGGALIVSGEASLISAGYLRIGYENLGVLIVRDSGTVANNSSSIDAGYNVGISSTIIIQDKGVMASANLITLGRFGTTIMTASGSSYVRSTGNLVIGSSGTATLTVEDDALIEAALVQVGLNAGSAGTLNLNGGFIQSAGISSFSGSATLNINGGGVRAIANVADFFGNFGTLTITGTGIDEGKSAFTVDTAGHEVTITNTLAFIGAEDTVALDKIGEGTLILDARSSLHGTTRISRGTLTAGSTNILANSRMVIGVQGVFDMNGLNQTIKGLENHGEVSFNTDRDNVGRMLTINGDLSGRGAFAMSVFLGNEVADTLVVTGVASGTHTIFFKNIGGTIDSESRLNILTLERGGTAIIISNDVNGGMGTYYLTPEIDPDTGATIYGLTATGNNSIAANAIFATAASLGAEWHFGLDSVRNRFGEIRALEKTDKAFTSTWYQGSAYRLETESPLVTIAYDQNTYGGAFGVDRVIPINDGRVLLGAFFAMNRSDRTYDVYGDGNTIDHCGGLYVTWLHDGGWFADFIAKANHYKNSFGVIASDYTATSADYSNYGIGFSMEFGHKFKFGQRFWVEPSFQIASAWFNPVDYTTSTKIKVGIDRANATQYRGQVALGWRLGNRCYPYFRAGTVRSNNSGGAIHAEKQTWETQYSGWRFEAGGGLAVAITDRNLLHFGYEYANADLYTRPWAVSLGYRRTW